ncbi:hypothetical protein HCO69_05455 [Pantoea sp. LS15]|uniref:YadA C-terminal domain-containing protein n=1 Tax=Enterobacterales TaxID=91347 RepID=UPI000E0FDF6E|nr:MULTISPECIES: YadA C-terminal domain-containing protein [Enterobacterales]NJQ19080.1 hypothetical protein [Pantoea sp. LS15]NKF45676.1 hypothetical protein [Pantoea sp. LS15]RDK15978.1 hypothetical protein CEJ32_05575 [Enterobacter sp. 9-2]
MKSLVASIAFGALVITTSTRADVISDFYNDTVNGNINFSEQQAIWNSLDKEQQEAAIKYSQDHGTNFFSDFKPGFVTPHADGIHNQAITLTDATQPIVDNSSHLDGQHSQPEHITATAKPSIDQSIHLDSNATDADRQNAKDQAMIDYLQSHVKNGVDGKNGNDGVTTTITKLDTATQTKVTSNSRAIQDNSQAISKMNNSFASLKDEVNDNHKEANAGISGAMAQANIPQVMNNQRVAIGAGVGGYDGENAVAVGASARLGDSVVIKATVSDDTADNVGYGAGLSVGW